MKRYGSLASRAGRSHSRAMLRFSAPLFVVAFALVCASACGGGGAVVVPQRSAEASAEASALTSSVRWEEETPLGVRALEMLPGGNLLFFAAGQEPAPPRLVRSRDGLETAAFPLAVHPDSQITIGDDKVLVLRGRDLDVYKTDGGRLFHVELPAAEGSIAAFASGYGETAFIITSRGALLVATPDGLAPVETNAPLTGASHMLRVGGQLIVARDESLWSVALSSGEVSEWASGLGVVREFVRDDEGRFVVLNAARELRLVSPDGDSAPLSSALLNSARSPLSADHIAFDAQGYTLAIVDAEEAHLRAYDYLALTGRTAPPAERVGAFTLAAGALGSPGLTGAEYWPFVGDSPPDYPADILWGFYPEEGVMFDGEVMSASASDAAVACMEQSHAALQVFIQRHAAALTEAAHAAPEETSTRFYLWVDDYSAASDPFPTDMREAKMWYWQRDPAVLGRIPGYWKWETVLRQNGECDIPDAEAAEVALQARLAGARE